MTARRIRDLRRLLQAEAQVYGAHVRIEHTGSTHLRAVFSHGDGQVFILAAATPSDWREHRHLRARARRALRSIISTGEI